MLHAHPRGISATGMRYVVRQDSRGYAKQATKIGNAGAEDTEEKEEAEIPAGGQRTKATDGEPERMTVSEWRMEPADKVV